MSDRASRIVIIGGNFAGIGVLHGLQNAINEGKIEVTVIERLPERFNHIGSTRGMVDAEFARKLFIPYTSLASQKCRFLHAGVESVKQFEVILDDGQRIPFDFLVVATGCRYAAPFYGTEPTIEGNMAVYKRYENVVRKSNDIVVVGGGSVGIEVATEIKSAYPEKNMTIVHSQSQFSLGMTSNKFPAHTLAKVSSMGVKVLFDERITFVADEPVIGRHEVTTEKGTVLPSDLTLYCVGVGKPNSSFMASLDAVSKLILDKQGYIQVQPTLQLRDQRLLNIFCLGDVAATDSPKTGISASQQAAVVAANIVKMVDGRSYDLVEFTSPSTQLMVLSIGKSQSSSELFFLPYWIADRIGTRLKVGDMLTNRIRSEHNITSTV